MAYDSAMTRAIVLELQAAITRARIERISQPRPHTVALYLVKGRESLGWLVLSADARAARVHLASQGPRNPLVPPPFCMVLRKYLEGGRIVDVSQPDLERIVYLTVSNPHASLPSATYILIAEIMGKHSNILLVEPESNQITDAVKRYGPEVSRYREVFPGRPYVPPPAERKADPLAVSTAEELADRLLTQPLESPLPAALHGAFAATGPEVAREIVARSGLPLETKLEFCGEEAFRRLSQAFREVWGRIAAGNFTPTLIRDDRGRPLACSALELYQYPQARQERWGRANDLVDYFFSWQEREEAFARQKAALQRVVKKHLDGIAREEQLQEEKLAEAGKAERWRVHGELVKANLYRLQGGERELEAENFFEPDCPAVQVPLDPRLSPVENARTYFRRYQKAVRTVKAARQRLADLKEESDYLESILVALESAAGTADLEEIHRELAAGHYLPAPATASKRARGASAPLKVLSSTGLTVLVGRNNRQNDHLTRAARPGDYWLHVQGFPGAHVIVPVTDSGEPDPVTLEEAALLAAYFSRAREAGKVAVDCTQARHVWKPQGARPGMVLYDHQRTIVMSMDRQHIDELLQPKE